MSRSERSALTALAALALALRVLAYFCYRFDSDEPQHLHVAWGWGAGMVQYRDFFDNHAPLFHMLSAPLLRLLGERSDILLWMRAPMVVLFAFVVWGTNILGKRLYDQRTALWSALVLVFLPPFFLKSIEYRTDNLWTALCVAAFIVAGGGPLTAGRMFVTGLILGTALCVSLKTMLVVVSLLIAGLIVDGWRHTILAAIPGFVIPPAILAAYFVHLGAWPSLVYCVVTFNELVTRTQDHVWIGRLLYPVLMTGLVVLAKKRRMRFFAVATCVYTITLCCFWVLISPRDFLPIMPLFAIFITAALLRLEERRPRLYGLVPTFIMLLLPFVIYYADWFERRTDEHITMMDQVLRLTRPGEPLQDLKGETIYRRRPHYAILEFITRAQLRSGILRDTVAEDVVRARCHVVQADGDFWPPRSREILSANFVDVGRLRASGQWLRPDGTFTIAIPGDYVIVDEHGQARGMLDGTPYAGPRALDVGPHRFAGDRKEKLVVFWAPAYARGFSPFHLKDRDF